MSLMVSSPKDNFVLVPEGTHLARCYRIVDMGTQKTTYMGKEKAVRKVQITWEIHGEDADGKKIAMSDGRPLVISRKFTPSLSPKAALRAFLVSWRGKQFTEEELNGFALPNILDKWCLLTVTHEIREDKTYANVASVSGVPSSIRSMGLPEAVNECVQFDLDDPNWDVFETLGDFIRGQIMESPEYRMIRNVDVAEEATYSKMKKEDIPF
jgi:hypothetical protein